MSKLINYRLRKARKTHGCDVCEKEIKRGQEYHWFKFLSENLEFYEWKECLLCRKFVQDFCTGYENWTQEEIIDLMTEMSHNESAQGKI